MLRVESGLNLGPFQNRLSDGMVRSSPRVKMVESEWFFKCNNALNERCIIVA